MRPLGIAQPTHLLELSVDIDTPRDFNGPIGLVTDKFLYFRSPNHTDGTTPELLLNTAFNGKNYPRHLVRYYREDGNAAFQELMLPPDQCVREQIGEAGSLTLEIVGEEGTTLGPFVLVSDQFERDQLFASAKRAIYVDRFEPYHSDHVPGLLAVLERTRDMQEIDVICDTLTDIIDENTYAKIFDFIIRYTYLSVSQKRLEFKNIQTHKILGVLSNLCCELKGMPDSEKSTHPFMRFLESILANPKEHSINFRFLVIVCLKEINPYMIFSRKLYESLMVDAAFDENWHIVSLCIDEFWKDAYGASSEELDAAALATISAIEIEGSRRGFVPGHYFDNLRMWVFRPGVAERLIDLYLNVFVPRPHASEGDPEKFIENASHDVTLHLDKLYFTLFAHPTLKIGTNEDFRLAYIKICKKFGLDTDSEGKKILPFDYCLIFNCSPLQGYRDFGLTEEEQQWLQIYGEDE